MFKRLLIPLAVLLGNASAAIYRDRTALLQTHATDFFAQKEFLHYAKALVSLKQENVWSRLPKDTWNAVGSFIFSQDEQKEICRLFADPVRDQFALFQSRPEGVQGVYERLILITGKEFRASLLPQRLSAYGIAVYGLPRLLKHYLPVHGNDAEKQEQYEQAYSLFKTSLAYDACLLGELPLYASRASRPTKLMALDQIFKESRRLIGKEGYGMQWSSAMQWLANPPPPATVMSQLLDLHEEAHEKRLAKASDQTLSAQQRKLIAFLLATDALIAQGLSPASNELVEVTISTVFHPDSASFWQAREHFERCGCGIQPVSAPYAGGEGKVLLGLPAVFAPLTPEDKKASGDHLPLPKYMREDTVSKGTGALFTVGVMAVAGVVTKAGYEIMRKVQRRHKKNGDQSVTKQVLQVSEETLV